MKFLTKMVEKKKAELEALYIAICEVVYDYDSFIDVATELTTFFQDGHTNIEVPYTPQDLCLNLKCCWSGTDDNELILKDGYEDIPKHARIMSVEGASIEDLIVAFADKIPHENIYLATVRI